MALIFSGSMVIMVCRPGIQSYNQYLLISDTDFKSRPQLGEIFGGIFISLMFPSSLAISASRVWGDTLKFSTNVSIPNGKKYGFMTPLFPSLAKRARYRMMDKRYHPRSTAERAESQYLRCVSGSNIFSDLELC